jgi:hypothetical protein
MGGQFFADGPKEEMAALPHRLPHRPGRSRTVPLQPDLVAPLWPREPRLPHADATSDTRSNLRARTGNPFADKGLWAGAGLSAEQRPWGVAATKPKVTGSSPVWRVRRRTSRQGVAKTSNLETVSGWPGPVLAVGVQVWA